MVKKLLSLLLVIILIIPISGCWDAVDINKRMLITAVVLDKKEGQYVFYAETANMENSSGQGGSSGSGGGSSKYITYKGCGATLTEAREEIERQVEQPLYLGSVNVLILTKRLAKSGLYEYLNRLNSDFDYRKKVITLTTSEEPENILKISKHGESAGAYIVDQIRNSSKIGYTFYRTTARYFEDVSSRTTGFAIPMLGLNQDTPSIIGYSIINNEDKYIGEIRVEDSRGLNILKMFRNKPEFRFVIPYNNVLFTIKVFRERKKIKSYYKNGKISFDVNLKFDAEIEYTSKICSISDETKKKLNDELEKTMKKELEETIKISQEKYKTDYLNFKDEFHINYPEVYHKMDWYKEYPKAKINVYCDIKLDTEKGIDYKTRYLE